MNVFQMDVVKLFRFNSEKQAVLLQLFAVFFAAILAFFVRLYSVIRFESVIHEFDPYFNYRTTRFMTENGFYQFHDWFDDMAWYPLGRIIGGTIYPGLMMTSSFIYSLLHAINVTMDIRNICVFLAPLFSSFTTLVTFLLTSEIQDNGAGLVAAAMIAIVPGYISRSVAGSYDNEGIAIFCMLFTFYLWIKAVKTGYLFWACACSLAYFYMVSSWGGYVFLINIIPIHVLILMLTGRFSSRIYAAYSTVYVLGTILSMQISFVGFAPVISSEHIGALGVFGLCQLFAFYTYLSGILTSEQLSTVLRVLGLSLLSIGLIGGSVLSATGKISPWTGRFYSLLDPTYAKNHIPIIASVAEHQPTAWSCYYFDLQFLTVMFPVGLYYCFRKLTDASIFAIIYGITSVYFSGVMVRLILVLAPIMCILGAIGVSGILKSFTVNLNAPDSQNIKTSSKPTIANGFPSNPSTNKLYKNAVQDSTYPFKNTIASFMVLLILVLLILFSKHCIWVTSSSYSSPSIVLATSDNFGNRHILDDYREAYYWLRQNTKADAKILSWWDYGYQITAIANRTVLVDNNTWNNTHIGRVGQAMASSEEEAYEIMKELDVDYVLVIFGGVLGYSSDDINKFIWMVRIAGSTEKGRHVNEKDYYTPQGEMRVDSGASSTMQNCLLYKLSYYRFWEMKTSREKPAGFDRVRNQVIGHQNYELQGLEEAYTSANWLVRLYRVKPYANRGVN
ncbi:Dolichyl-diphosphooligosaccharide--protein glycosyltransferase subunit STT3A [Schistosoma japonicum]|uniref:Dolichyl-diphosphooligosaccharide--protein glycosyltransferase subunit STT3A n=1 Tax=Schistosoma japonicum TaxID=6182 RepID=A0A4Z2DR71_SCHJA|nr:Dolichyl-diphosphooligosaccharide--protein glycosyltransferase subunit STT3A [Schistosoma japonicum]